MLTSADNITKLTDLSLRKRTEIDLETLLGKSLRPIF